MTTKPQPTTIEERFDDKFLPGQDRVPYYVPFDDAKDFCRQEIEAAVQKERERCLSLIQVSPFHDDYELQSIRSKIEKGEHE